MKKHILFRDHALFSVAILISLIIPFSGTSQTSAIVWNEDFNNITYGSCYTSDASAYWANCSSPLAGPQNSMVSAPGDALTNLGLTQSPLDLFGGRFLTYWSDGSYLPSVPAPDNIIFSKTITGLSIGNQYRISYKTGAFNAINPASIGLDLNGVTVITPTATTTSWINYSYTWTASTTSVTFDWFNTSKATTGNDFALDDLLLEQLILLPVRLTDFAAVPQNCEIKLQWKTEDELNFSHFEIESSSDGKFFKKIGSLPATLYTHSYHFITAKVNSGKNYYRLKMVDLDGKIEYSKIVAAINRCSESRVHVYPNPAQDYIFIAGLEGKEKLLLVDLKGRIVKRQGAEGRPTIKIEIGNLPDAIYYVAVIKDEQLLTQIKIVKRKGIELHDRPGHIMISL